MRRRFFVLVIAPVLVITAGGEHSTYLTVVRAASSFTVPAGADLQRALNTALPGDTVLLESGATYVGNFYLPRRSGNDNRPITLQTALGSGPALGRITPQLAAGFAKLQSPDQSPALRTEPGARFWRVQLVEFGGNRGGEGDIVTLGDGSDAQTRLADVPSDLVLDRVYIHGDPQAGQKRGVALNSARTKISNSYISDIKAIGQDSQAIAGWNGPGEYTIENNYLEAAGENVMFGGADPAILDLIPTNIVIHGNTLSKPLEWRQAPWQVKNLFELKNARNVTIEQNLLQRNWEGAQSGYAILFTVRNEEGRCPWCLVETVAFRHNVVRDVAAGLAILGIDPIHPSQQEHHIVVEHNLFDGIDTEQWGGDGYFLQLTDTPRDVTIDHNTIIQGGSNGIVKIDGRVDGFVFTNNLASQGNYGIIGSDHGIGNDTIRALLPGSTITRNVIAGGDQSAYPPGNLFPGEAEFRAQFVDFAGHDFLLRPASAWVTAATDHHRLGADIGQLPTVQEPPQRRGR
jgi:hypothetical protein